MIDWLKDLKVSMTVKEALNWCEHFENNLVLCNVDSERRTLGLQAMQVCKSALEKQIPKKPIWNFGWCCPACKDNWVIHFKSMPEENEKYCWKCGQALDWSDTE